MGKPRVVEQAGELPQGQPPAARSRLEAAQGAARAEGAAGLGAHPQRPRHRGMETVPERIEQREGGWSTTIIPFHRRQLFLSSGLGKFFHLFGVMIAPVRWNG